MPQPRRGDGEHAPGFLSPRVATPSVHTVNTYLERIRVKYAKLGRAAPTKAALVARAPQDGLIGIDELG